MQIIMFGMGTSMSFSDFAGVVKMPKGVFVGLLCQFSIMPFLGFVMAKMFHFPPEIAAGIILVGATPCGLASNVMNFIAGSNLALSVTLVAVSTLMAPVVTPLLMQLYAGQMVPIHFVDMMIVIMKIVVLPIIAGLIFNKIVHGRAKWLDRIMPIVSMAGIAYIITITIAAGRDELLVIGGVLIFVEILHNALGYVFGYWGARLFRLDEKSCRTIAVTVGLQNGGMASGIALEMGKLETMGLATAIFGPWMNVSGSIVANWWHRKPVKQSSPD
ncbi:Pantothenate precursors transporter PanS [subsurface metagenome]